VIAETRIRDADGRLRHVRVTARTAAQARQVLKERLLDRPMFGSTRVLSPQSTFADLAEVWVADLAALDPAEARELVVDAWRMVVPQKLTRAYDLAHPDGPG
jgi:hypothetical protein